MDDAQSVIAVAFGVANHAQRDKIVNGVELQALLEHFLANRIEMLGAPVDFGFDALGFEAFLQFARRLQHLRGALGARALHQGVNLFVNLRFEVFEGAVLEFPLDAPDAQAVRNRREKSERFGGNLAFFGVGKGVERSHIVQTVGELDDDDAHVARHRQKEFSQVFALFFGLGIEVDFLEFGNAFDQMRDIGAETLIHFLE